MSQSALILELRPKYEELEGEPMYTEQDVKRILFGFARDLGCKWSDKELREFIATIFEN